jgi:4-alpha-glucanotransferase
MKRMAHCFELYDVVRIDHFRGFDEYYSIPYGDPTAEFGKWEKGPGFELFKAMKERFGDNLRVIAEDLGFLTPSVLRLVKRTGFPGMKVLQFAFDSREESDYLPHNYTSNTIVYTGTHDNQTTRGWFETCNSRDRAFAKKYLDIHSRKDIAWNFIRSAQSSVSNTCIIPMQDYLNLDDSARINTPSTLGNNWKWRMRAEACTDELAQRMYEMAHTYGRI